MNTQISIKLQDVHQKISTHLFQTSDNASRYNSFSRSFERFTLGQLHYRKSQALGCPPTRFRPSFSLLKRKENSFRLIRFWSEIHLRYRNYIIPAYGAHRSKPHTEPRVGILTNLDFEVTHLGEIWTQTRINHPCEDKRPIPHGTALLIPSPLSIEPLSLTPYRRLTLSTIHLLRNPSSRQPTKFSFVYLLLPPRSVLLTFPTAITGRSLQKSVRIPSYSREFTIIFCSRGCV